MFLALAHLGCGGAQAERPASQRTERASDLRVRRADFVQHFRLTGELKAVHSDRVLAPRTPSWQIQIRWIEDDGTIVTQGQKVVELDNTALVSELEEKSLAELSASIEWSQKKAELQAAEADKRFQLEQRIVELEKAGIEAEVPEVILPRRDYQERQLALARAHSAHDKAQQELDSFRKASEAELAILRIALEKASREVEAAERAIASLTLKAPRDGILVVEENPNEGRKFQIGDTAWTGLTVARIPDLSSMGVVAFLNDVDDGRIHVGNSAECTVDTYPELRFTGTVRQIASIAQETGWRSLRRSFRVVVDLDETDAERMRPGMSVKVVVEAVRLPEVLLAPRGGLDLTTEPPLAFLRKGGEVDVRIGPCNALDCVVEEGLSEGEHLRRRG